MAPFPVGLPCHTGSERQGRSEGDPGFSLKAWLVFSCCSDLGGNYKIEEKSGARFWFEIVCQVPFKLYFKVKQKMRSKGTHCHQPSDLTLNLLRCSVYRRALACAAPHCTQGQAEHQNAVILIALLRPLCR